MHWQCLSLAASNSSPEQPRPGPALLCRGRCYACLSGLPAAPVAQARPEARVRVGAADLDAAPVALAHERLELVHDVGAAAAGAGGGAVPRHRREEAHSRVAPVVAAVLVAARDQLRGESARQPAAQSMHGGRALHAHSAVHLSAQSWPRVCTCALCWARPPEGSAAGWRLPDGLAGAGRAW